jgi:hypothetical protein
VPRGQRPAAQNGARGGVISDITPDSCRFEQAFSDDGGKTWEVNWIALDTRVKDPTGDR